MSSALVYVVSFIVALGVLITVHEFGHYWVARRLGVKVLRFSLGFGKTLWSWRSRNGETEYVLAALPLGGYVKMLDEREGEVDAAERSRAFNNKSIGTRIAVVVAGPAFNFLFAIAAFWALFMMGVPGLKPLIGEVAPGSLAQTAGLRSGDQIMTVDGRATPTWESARLALFEGMLDRKPVTLGVRDEHGRTAQREINFAAKGVPIEPDNLTKALGISLWRPPALVGRVHPGSPAQQAGLKSGDLVVAADGKPIRYWGEWVTYVRKRPDTPIRVTIERAGRRFDLTLTPERKLQGAKAYGQVGVSIPAGTLEKIEAVAQYGPVKSLIAGTEKTWDMSVLMLRVLGNIATGQASLRNISGPLTIAQYAGESASLGIVPFLTFLAVVSVSLGVLNLLPIPILDGGHLLYYLIELVKGGPISEQAQAIGQRIGILLLLMVMALAFYNDILRLFS